MAVMSSVGINPTYCIPIHNTFSENPLQMIARKKVTESDDLLIYLSCWQTIVANYIVCKLFVICFFWEDFSKIRNDRFVLQDRVTKTRTSSFLRWASKLKRTRDIFVSMRRLVLPGLKLTFAKLNFQTPAHQCHDTFYLLLFVVLWLTIYRH